MYRSQRGSAWLAALTLLATTSALTMSGAGAASPHGAAKKAKVSVTRLAGVPSVTRGGAALTLKVGVRNKARVKASKQISFRLSRDARLDPTDALLGTARTGKLKPKATKQVRATVPLPGGLAPGSYRVLACIDGRCKGATTSVPGGGTAAPDRGTLTGTLSFARATPFESDTTLAMNATVDVAMSYVGPVTRPDELQSTGSTYSLGRTIHRDVVSGPCTTSTDDHGVGGGTLLESPRDDEDEIFANMALLDLSEISLGAVLRYERAVTTRVTGEETCQPHTTTGPTSAERLGVELKLKQVSRTATEITYRVASWHDASATGSVWESVTGTLRLHLG